MIEIVEINPGEIVVKFAKPKEGKLTFSDLGFTNDDLKVVGGNLRIVFDLEGIGEHHYYKMPTIELAYDANVAETHWQCEFNNEVILDKYDHHGHSTVLLLNRKKISELEHRHENSLIVHGQFPQEVNLIAADSYINFFS